VVVISQAVVLSFAHLTLAGQSYIGHMNAIKMFGLASGLCACLTATTMTTKAADGLKPGDTAPDFNLQGSDGKTYKLSDFKGKKAVVLAWFPKAFTGGCTAECKSLRETGDLLRKFDVVYFTASTDTPDVNKKFAESLELDYPILSDPTLQTARAYGVVSGEKKTAARHTFYIGKDGKILHVDTSVKTATHGPDMAAKLKELGVPSKS
jgi:thioredoxin-dependent peroxiredoxin